ncbi:hypothetical protein B296_00008631 [Ensete ventricosum]|uniref:Uncharacterized protein n=1 Tax=Ensete ventricosum TaxID=4639 RepID=A0A427ACT7_ENSVE|nr:hypothetical protein B296_00008631 [Ensete ventricosum]
MRSCAQLLACGGIGLVPSGSSGTGWIERSSGVDPIEQGLRNSIGVGIDPIEWELGNLNGLEADPIELSCHSISRFYVPSCFARYGRYVPVRWFIAMQTVLYRAVQTTDPVTIKIDHYRPCKRSKSTVIDP